MNQIVKHFCCILSILIIAQTVHSKKTFYSKGPRIVGGKPAADGQFPYMVGLNLFAKPVLTGICGGTLINKNWVLSAAHCFMPGFYKVEMHFGDIEFPSKTGKGQILTSSYVQIHEQFREICETPQNDIALIKLPKPIDFNHYIKPIDVIANKPLATPPVEVIAAGWGKTGDGEGRSHTLLFVNLVTKSNKECAEKLKPMHVTENNICTKGNAKQNVCFGDSGGPLIQINEGKHVIVGIVSFGAPTCENDIPDVFSSTYKFRNWINEMMARTKFRTAIPSSGVLLNDSSVSVTLFLTLLLVDTYKICSAKFI